MGDTRDHPVESLLQETPRGEGGASRRSRLDPPWMAGKMNSENPSVPLNPLAEFNQISSWFSSRGPGPGGCVGYVWGGPSWGSPGSSMTVGVERKTLGEAPEWGASSFRRAPRVRLASCLSLRGERCLLTEAPLGLLLYSDRVPRDAPHLHPHQVPHFSRRAAAPGAPSAVQPIRDTPVPALPVALPLPRAAFPCLLRLGWAGLGWAGRTCSWAGGARLPPQVTAHPSQLLALTHSGHGGSEEQLSISEDFRDWPEKKLPQLMTSSSRVKQEAEAQRGSDLPWATWSAMAWEGRRRWPKSLGPCTHVGDPEEAPGSWLRIGTALAIVAIWGVNHQMEDLSFSLCLSVILPFK
nr:uncharacterized protein LOC127492053 isoform X2 [Oryctolagus cuniculus]